MTAKFIRSKPVTKTDLKSFYFSVEPKPHFTAGQFTEIAIKGIGKHWFTISSPPSEPEIRITTRLTGSDFKNALDNLKAGDEVSFAEPMGDFVLPIDVSIPILMVAAGIGVTPYLSILGDQLSRSSSRNLNLIYAAKSDEDFVEIAKYLDLLISYAKIIGPLTSESILTEAKKLDSPYVYISGPEPLVEKLMSELKSSGFPEQQLIGDYFPGYN